MAKRQYHFFGDTLYIFAKLILAGNSNKVCLKKNGTDIWPYNSKPINSTAKLLFIRSKGIVLRIKMRYGRSL